MLGFRLKVSPDGSARPEEVLECLGLRDLLDQGAVLVRTHVELVTDDRTVLSTQGDGGESAPGNLR